jgi:DNA-binding CsgD family transcriptional regulator
MHLSSTQCIHLSKVVDVLARPLPRDELRTALAKPLMELLDADYVASFVWNESEGRFADGISTGVNPAHLTAYENDFQYRDPISHELRARRYPTLVTQVVSQRDLVKTEFFDGFLKDEGLYWGVNLYGYDGAVDVGDLRIWRQRQKHNFGASEIELLRVIYPAFVTALARSRSDNIAGIASHAPMTTARAVDILMRSTSLSRREAEVTNLVALGRSDKEIARELGIGFTTVRSHLKNTFQKLGCDSRIQLARRTIALSSH